MVVRFPEFTVEYFTSFEAKLKEVKLLEQDVVLSDEQKASTNALYAKADALDKELNFLSFYFKRAGFDSGIVSAVKKDLNNSNIEGAVNKLEGLRQFCVANKSSLVAKGMADGFPDELDAKRGELDALNELQNEKINALTALYNANKGVYKELRRFISTVSGAGKIMYQGSPKAKEYTISAIINRMRSGNGGKDEGTTDDV